MRRIAVVGGGIAGLASAWLLSRKFQITLFEAGREAGGHTNTVDVSIGEATFPVDTGFLVFNERTYPNLCAMFDLLGVGTAKSEMSFSVTIESEGLEWAGSTIGSLFAQRRNLLNPRFFGMLRDILRFNREATALVSGEGGGCGTLGEFLEQGRYGSAFRDWYLLPMSAAIWSCPTATMLQYPAQTFFRFCHNHGLLAIRGRPQWRTVSGGGREYVRSIVSRLQDVRLGTPVSGIRRNQDSIVVHSARNGAESFDGVVLATHGDQALRLLDDPVDAEREILGAFRFQDNHAWLHGDESLLPRARGAWAAWNYRAGLPRPDGQPVSVSYLINRLQPLPCKRPVIVSLNPLRDPVPHSVSGVFRYSHPVFDFPAVKAQKRLGEIQGRDRTWFCGAWTGYGFHEDGLRSALAVAKGLGVEAPWQTV